MKKFVLMFCVSLLSLSLTASLYSQEKKPAAENTPAPAAPKQLIPSKLSDKDKKTEEPPDISTSIHKKNVVYIIGKYSEFINNLLVKEIVDNDLIKANESEMLLGILAEKSMSKTEKLSDGKNDISSYDYAKEFNNAVLASMKGRFTTADRALSVAKTMEGNLKSEIEETKKKIANPAYMDPDEIYLYKEKIAEDIEYSKSELFLVDEEIKEINAELGNVNSDYKALQLRLKKVLGILKDDANLKILDKEIKNNPADAEIENKDEKAGSEEKMSAEAAIEEKSFLYAELNDIEDNIRQIKTQLAEMNSKASEIKAGIKKNEESLKNPQRELTDNERAQYLAEMNALLERKIAQHDRQKALMPELEKNLEAKKSELAESMKKYSPDMLKEIERQFASIEIVFKKFVEYKKKSEIFNRTATFKQAVSDSKKQGEDNKAEVNKIEDGKTKKEEPKQLPMPTPPAPAITK